MDVAHTEAIESGLDLLIEKRHARRVKEEGERAAEEMYAESVRRYHQRKRERNRWAWVRHFDRMADNHAALSQSYRERAEKLLEGAA